MPEFIYHITTPEQWTLSEITGVYQPQFYDEEGFIHCCEIGQILGVVSRYFSGQQNLLILKIKTQSLSASLRYESLGEGVEAFPHLYARLKRDAVDSYRLFSADDVNELDYL